jgi:uncharacterized protein (TIGR00255 family)
MDLNFRFPEMLRHLEMPIREKIRKKLNRGKLDINLRFTSADANTSSMSINNNLVQSLVQTHSKIAEISGNDDKLSTLDLMQWSGVLEEPETDETKRDIILIELFENALSHLIEARAREGEMMKQLLLDRITLINEQVQMVRGEMPVILQSQKEKIINRLKEAEVEFDSERLEQEMVYLAQKADIAEELDRLETHVNEISRILSKGGNVGRRLDFLLQELNREANTLGSKSISKITTSAGVELKVIIEQMREQVQNIE